MEFFFQNGRKFGNGHFDFPMMHFLSALDNVLWVPFLLFLKNYFILEKPLKFSFFQAFLVTPLT